MLALGSCSQGVLWKSASPLDSYLGYFLNDNSPDELFALSMGSNYTAPGVVGSLRIVHVGKCSGDAFASDQFYFDAHLIGSRAVAQERTYNVDTGKYGPEIPSAFSTRARWSERRRRTAQAFLSSCHMERIRIGVRRVARELSRSLPVEWSEIAHRKRRYVMDQWFAVGVLSSRAASWPRERTPSLR